jgi:hypothetical protein
MLTRLQNPNKIEIDQAAKSTPAIDTAEAQATKAKKKKKKTKAKKNKNKSLVPPEALIEFISDHAAPHRQSVPIVQVMMPDDLEVQKSDDTVSEGSTQTLPAIPVTSEQSTVAKKIEQAVRHSSGLVEAPPARRKLKRTSLANTKEAHSSDSKALSLRRTRAVTPASDEDSDVRSKSNVLLIFTPPKQSKKKKEEDDAKKTLIPQLSSPESSADLVTSDRLNETDQRNAYNRWARKDSNSIMKGSSTRPATESLWPTFLDDEPDLKKHYTDVILSQMDELTLERSTESQGRFEEVVSDEEEREPCDSDGMATESIADSVIACQDEARSPMTSSMQQNSTAAEKPHE